MKAPTALIKAAEQAILDCRSTPNPVSGTGEVAEVARLVLQLPEKLVQRWSGHLAAGELDVLGVFAHKTPKARWTDPRNAKSQSPELCDLLLVLDCEEPSGRVRRALVIQAKVADAGCTTGQFTVEKNGPDIQRYLYTHWPDFTLTGLSPKPPAFKISPTPSGTCRGTRYACINVNAVAPASGWWLEDAQAAPPAMLVGPSSLGPSGTLSPSSGYDGTFQATVPLGQALHDMVAGTLGAPLTIGSDWERLVQHLEKVAEQRHKAGKKPPDVVAAAAGTLLPHVAAASLFMTDSLRFFDIKATDGYEVWGDGEPPGHERPLLTIGEQDPGFGIIYVRLVSPKWHDEIGD